MSKVKISDLTPDDKNYNKGTQFGNSLIEKSLRKFGAGRSILLDKNNRIIAGNKTIENAYTIGLDDVLIVETTGNQIVAVKRMDIDLDSKIGRELALADNASAKANIEWDYDNIQQDWEIAEQEEWGIDNSAFVKELEAEEDDFDTTPPLEPITVLGDLYEIGEHRLLCGDSTDSDQVAKLIGNNKVDFIWTDPPYGINEKGDRSKRGGLAKGSNLPDFKDDTIQYAIDAFNQPFNLDVKTQVWFGANYYCHTLPQTANWLVWDKRVEDNQRDNNSDCELAWIKSNFSSIRIFRHLWKGMLKDSERGEKRVHATQKPIALVEFCINEYNKDCKTILDYFGGSGVCMVAAHQLKKQNLTMEFEPHNCDVIVNRMIALDPDIKIKLNGKAFEKSR